MRTRLLPFALAAAATLLPAGAFACATLTISSPTGSAITPVVQAGQSISLRGTSSTALTSLDVLVGGRVAATFTPASGLVSSGTSWSLAIDKPILQRGTNAVTVRSAAGCTPSNTSYVSTARLAFTPPAGVPRSPLARFLTDYTTISDAFPIYLSYPGLDYTQLNVTLTNLTTNASRSMPLTDADIIWRGQGSELYFTLGRFVGGNSPSSLGQGVYRLQVSGMAIDSPSLLAASSFINISTKLIRNMSVANASNNTYTATFDTPLFSNVDRSGKPIWTYAKVGNADQAAAAGWWKELSPQTRIELSSLADGRVTVSLPPATSGTPRIAVCLYTALGRSNCQQ